MTRIAIIPARGDSKRIPRKNIKPFLGKPVIAYSLAAALDSGLFDEVMVSTDNDEIAEVAKKYGGSIPFKRSDQASDDHAVLADVISEVLKCYQRIGKKFEEFCCILPTAPFIKAERIIEGFDILQLKGFFSVFPVLKYSYPIQRSLNVNEKSGQATMIWPENLNKRSQDFRPVYHDSGQFYCGKVAHFLKEHTLFTSNSGVIHLSELEAQDIDSEDDWNIAELKFRILMSTNQ